MSATIAVIGVPSSLGGLPIGSELGPARLREAGLSERLRGLGLEVTDLGDVPVPGRRGRGNRGGSPLSRIEAIARWVSKHAWRAHAEGMVPLVLGGDHSVALGSIAASSHTIPGVGLVWVDAHPDFNTPETTPTGNVHGMTLAIAAGMGPGPLVRLNGSAPMVHPERMVVIGVRSMDAGEYENLRQAGVRVFDSDYVEEHGVRSTVGEAMKHLSSNGVRTVHLSVDLDVLDPRYCPGVSTPVDGGLSADELTQLASLVAEMAPIASLDLVELTPEEDRGGATVEAAIRTAESAFKHLASGKLTPQRRGRAA
jgi:arginase